MKSWLAGLVVILSIAVAHAQQGLPGGGGNGVPSGGGGGGGGGSGTVTSIATGCQATGGTITTSGTISTQLTTSNTYTGTGSLASGDACHQVLLNDASAATLTLANVTSGQYGRIINIGAGVWTLAAGSGSIQGCSTLAQYASADWQFDGTNFNVACGPGNITATRTVSGTTDTYALSDCGSVIIYTNSSAVTATIPATLPVGCNIAMLQAGAGKVSINGSAVTPATLQTFGGSATGSAGQWATIGITIESNVGGSSAVAVLQGNAS